MTEQDLPPTADAGEDIETLVGENIILTGEQSSDDTFIVLYTWELIAGDGASVNLGDTEQGNLVVSFEQAGAYTFSLTVEDEIGQTDVDEVEITVTGVDLRLI